MHILVLSPYGEKLRPSFERCADIPIIRDDQLTEIPQCFDWIVSFGYRHIIKEPILGAFKNRIINLHAALLPFNKGAHPNFWSWFDNTPKGVTIHKIDAGIDTGPILVQKEIKFDHGGTLAKSYAALDHEMLKMFDAQWPSIREGRMPPIENKGGTFHRCKDIDRWFPLLPKGWDTPVDFVRRLGEEVRAEQGMSEALVAKTMADIAA